MNKVKYIVDIKHNISLELMEFMNIYIDKKVSERDIIMYVVNYVKYYNLLEEDNKVKIDKKLSKLLNKNEDIISYMELFRIVVSHIISNSN